MILFRALLSSGASRLLACVGGPAALRIVHASLLLIINCRPCHVCLVLKVERLEPPLRRRAIPIFLVQLLLQLVQAGIVRQAEARCWIFVFLLLR